MDSGVAGGISMDVNSRNRRPPSPMNISSSGIWTFSPDQMSSDHAT